MPETSAPVGIETSYLNKLYQHLEQQNQRFVGYPCNTRFDYSELYRFLKFSLNNIGDPYAPRIYKLNTCDAEREVIDFCAELTRAPRDNYWGYVTHGGTEGNMYGLFLARELHPEGIVYYSQDAHYSISKTLKLLRCRNIMIRSNTDGTLNLDDLEATLRIKRDIPPIICANIGTTMKGAIDDLNGIKAIMEKLAIPEFYIHCDCALSGMILPFVEEPQAFDFADGADSLSISGHKMIGSPMPCGIVLAKKNNLNRIARSIEYIGSLDTTLAGSRNGLSPLFLWYAIRKAGREGLKAMVQSSLEVADFAVQQFQAAKIPAYRHRNSITVVFPRPDESIVQRWQLAVQQDIAHVITVPHVTKDHISELIADIKVSKSSSGANEGNAP